MAIRVGLVFFVMALALTIMAKASPTFDTASTNAYGVRGTCNGKIGDCINDDEEGMMASESNRRTLAGQARYISYGAMKRNSIPCNKRGASYYACTGHAQANPYSRGCTQISKCPRNTR